MATKKALEKKLAKLESINDQLVTELGYVDGLMQLVGFSGGIVALKATAQELYEKGESSLESEEEDFEGEEDHKDEEDFEDGKGYKYG